MKPKHILIFKADDSHFKNHIIDWIQSISKNNTFSMRHRDNKYIINFIRAQDKKNRDIEFKLIDYGCLIHITAPTDLHSTLALYDLSLIFTPEVYQQNNSNGALNVIGKSQKSSYNIDISKYSGIKYSQATDPFSAIRYYMEQYPDTRYTSYTESDNIYVGYHAGEDSEFIVRFNANHRVFEWGNRCPAEYHKYARFILGFLDGTLYETNFKPTNYVCECSPILTEVIENSRITSKSDKVDLTDLDNGISLDSILEQLYITKNGLS